MLQSLLLLHCDLDALVLLQLVRRLAEALRVHRLHGHGLPEEWNHPWVLRTRGDLIAMVDQRGFTRSVFERFHFKVQCVC